MLNPLADYYHRLSRIQPWNATKSAGMKLSNFRYYNIKNTSSLLAFSVLNKSASSSFIFSNGSIALAHMKVILTFSLVIQISISSQAQKFEWCGSMGSYPIDNGFDLVVDNVGSIYTTGFVHASADIAPDTSVLLVGEPSSASFLYLNKVDSSGSLIWGYGFGDTTGQGVFQGFGHSVALDKEMQHIHVGGYFVGSLDFDPSSITNIRSSVNTSATDIIIAKYTTNGELIWARNMGGSLYEEVRAITVDLSGSVIGTGNFTSTNADFNPGTSSYILSSSGLNDIFINKLDKNGNFRWARKIGGSNSTDIGYAVATDAQKNVYASGSYSGIVDFNPGAAVYNLSNGLEYSSYILKLDSNGNFIWAKTFQGGLNSNFDLALDLSGNILLTGFFKDSVDFDPGIGTSSMVSNGNEDIYVVKLDANGNYIWARKFGGILDNEYGYGIHTDGHASVYVSGKFYGTSDFDPGADTFLMTSHGNADAFVCKLDSSGNFQWAHQHGNLSIDEAMEIQVDQNFNIHYLGNFTDSVDFNPALDSTVLKSNGDKDIFLVKLSQCFQTESEVFEQQCDSFLSPSGNYSWSQSGVYYDTIQNVHGCDSIIEMHLTIIKVDNSVTTTDSSIISIHEASNYQWIRCDSGNTVLNGDTFVEFTPKQTGTYAVIVTESGCVDTSECIEVSVVGFDQFNLSKDYQIFPNPTSGVITISGLSDEVKNIRIYNQLGALVSDEWLNPNFTNRFELPESPGCYYVQIVEESGQFFFTRGLRIP